MKFANQVAHVTGAGGGIGRAVALALAAEGAHIVCIGRGLKSISDTGQAVRAAGGTTTVVALDVYDPADINAPRLEKLPPPDLLVTCHAAAVLNKLVVDMGFNELLHVIHNDLVGTIMIVQAALRHMLPRHSGSIVCFSSIHAHASCPNRSAYAAAKAGIEGFVRAAAMEAGPQGITINTIAPGFTVTARTLAAAANPQVEDIVGRIPIQEQEEGHMPHGRMATSAEIADAVLFLLGNKYTNGTTLVVDGGLTVSIGA